MFGHLSRFVERYESEKSPETSSNPLNLKLDTRHLRHIVGHDSVSRSKLLSRFDASLKPASRKQQLEMKHVVGVCKNVYCTLPSGEGDPERPSDSSDSSDVTGLVAQKVHSNIFLVLNTAIFSVPVSEGHSASLALFLGYEVHSL